MKEQRRVVPASDLVRGHFQKAAPNFDSLYSGQRPRLLKIFDQLFLKDLYDRFELTFRECQYIEGCSVLDVGCGSGRYAIEFARRGARRVVGIDFAQSMVDLAGSLSRDAGLESKCIFICDDFLQIDLGEVVDYSLAMGVFDYVQQPAMFLDKMGLMTTRRMLASFPKDTFFRSTQRRIRYKLKGCPVYFYKKEDIEQILTSLGMTSFRIVEFQGDYFVAISMAEGPQIRW